MSRALQRRVLFALPLLATVRPAWSDPGWEALREQGIGLMRHGGAVVAQPGMNMPVPGCEMSAVLTDPGREEMRRLGERFREAGISAARLVCSHQCTAWETALLLNLGPLSHDAVLDPLRPDEPPHVRREALERALQAAADLRQEQDGPVIFITHRSNIMALTGIELPQGEILVLRPQGRQGFALAGRITPD